MGTYKVKDTFTSKGLRHLAGTVIELDNKEAERLKSFLDLGSSDVVDAVEKLQLEIADLKGVLSSKNKQIQSLKSELNLSEKKINELTNTKNKSDEKTKDKV